MAIWQSTWDYLRGNDLKARLPDPPAATTPGTEQKFFFWTTDSYDEVADAVGPTLAAALGGSRADVNSAVFACLRLLSYSFQEAPLRVFREQPDGQDEFLDDHPFMALLADPHPALSDADLYFWLQWAKHCSGDAYLRKIRTRGNDVHQLWPISSRNMWPETTDADRRAGVFISHYVFDDGMGSREEVPVADVVHFRLGVDEQDHRHGLSPIKRLLREVSSDDEATRFTDALLKNFAVNSLVVTTPDRTLTADQAEQLKANLASRFGGSNRGAVGVLNNGATVQQLGFSPQQLDLKVVHQLPESRICAALGVPAELVGLSIGLEQSTYNNKRQSQENFFEQTMLPLWRSDAATLQKQLFRRDFEADPKIKLRYDTTEVRALQEDLNAVYTRVSLAVEKGWLTKDEARAEVGKDPLPNGLGEMKEPEPPPALLGSPGGRPGAPQDQHPPNAPPKALALDEQKALALGAVPGLLDTLQDLVRPALQADVEAYLEGQRERVVAALEQEGG
jgi:HK97 family phage portal protein